VTQRFPSPSGGQALLFETSEDWRAWLAAHHANTTEAWLVTFKKGSGRISLSYEDALDEATCFGWVDGIVRGAAADHYLQRWVPRRARSNWSPGNRARARRLAAEGRMTAPGAAALPQDLRVELGLDHGG